MSGENGRHSVIRQKECGPCAHAGVACSCTILEKKNKKRKDNGVRVRGQEVLKELHLSCGYVETCFLLALFRKLLSFPVSYIFFGDIFKWHVSRFHTFVSLVGTFLYEIKNRLQHSPDKYRWFDEFDVALCMLKFLWGVFCLFFLLALFLLVLYTHATSVLSNPSFSIFFGFFLF